MTTTPAPAETLRSLVERIHRHQKALDISDLAFVRRYPVHLGSHKTWASRLKGGVFNGLDIPKWTGKLTALTTIIDGTYEASDFCETLPFFQNIEDTYHLLQGRTSDRRCALIPAPTGCGKTTSLRALQRRHPKETCFVQALDTWKNSRTQILAGLATALGCPAHPRNAALTLRNLIEFLKHTPLTLLVDDAHEGGVQIFKLVKTLIDQSKAKFLLAIYPTEWRRLLQGTDDPHQEVLQLLGRAVKPHLDQALGGVLPEDIAAYLVHALKWTPALAEETAPALAPKLQRSYNLRALADACELSAALADANDQPTVTPADLLRHLTEICR